MTKQDLITTKTAVPNITATMRAVAFNSPDFSLLYPAKASSALIFS